MERIRFKIKNLFSHDQPSFKIYPKVPLEIVLEIFAHLQSSDQICLSLCCKYLYEAFLYLLKLKRLDSARLYPPETRPLLCLNNEANERPRTRLLRQLEDKRWKFCNECWFLHPYDKRRANFFNGYAKVHDFISRGKLKGLGDRSMSQQSLARHRGVVEICPCLTITFQDKVFLMEDIAKIEEMSPHRGQVHAVAPLRGRWRNRQYRGRIRHECVFVDHPFTKLRIVTEFWKEGPFLTTSSDYEFEMGADKSPKKTQLDLKTLYTFPDESLGSWMREFFQEAGSKFSGWPDDRSLTLLGEGSSRNFQIRTFRNLGEQEWPNKAWIRNCCKS